MPTEVGFDLRRLRFFGGDAFERAAMFESGRLTGRIDASIHVQPQVPPYDFHFQKRHRAANLIVHGIKNANDPRRVVLSGQFLSSLTADRY